MNKKIFILNGKPGSGKDTFAAFLNEFVPTDHYSSVTKVKAVAEMCGWDGEKNLKSRKFLSDLKYLTSEFNDMAFQDVKKKIDEFLWDDETYEVLLIDFREPEEIERCYQELGAESIYIYRPDVYDQETSNTADKFVYNYYYDYTIINDGTLDNLRELAKGFYEKFIKE